jgi:hypothetical protein
MSCLDNTESLAATVSNTVKLSQVSIDSLYAMVGLTSDLIRTFAFNMEMSIVHGGAQSMPLSYFNNNTTGAKYSEVELTLPAGQRDWTVQGIGELSLWFRGETTNGPEPLYVAVSNIAGASAIVVHDDPDAATIDTWTEWVIPLQALADQGIDLTDIDRIAIGLGTRGNMTIPGGLGKMYIDDVRLYRLR